MFFSEQFLLSSGVVPLTTPGQATGGGQIDHVSGGTGVTFGFTAYSREDGSILAQCSVVDEDVHIVCDDATQYSQAGNTATFSGSATVNGLDTTYRIEVVDSAESGIGQDSFAITTRSGYSAGGILTQGDVQVHPTQ